MYTFNTEWSNYFRKITSVLGPTVGINESRLVCPLLHSRSKYLIQQPPTVIFMLPPPPIKCISDLAKFQWKD